MGLARDCSGRVPVLAATGNLHSVILRLVFTVNAKMALLCSLALPRGWLAKLWKIANGRNSTWLPWPAVAELAPILTGQVMLNHGGLRLCLSTCLMPELEIITDGGKITSSLNTMHSRSLPFLRLESGLYDHSGLGADLFVLTTDL